MRVTLAFAAVVMGASCAVVTSANGQFECAAMHGGSPSNGNMGSFGNGCASAIVPERLLLPGVVVFLMIVLMESLVMWSFRRFPERNRAKDLIGTGWTPFLLYGTGVWLTHGLASGAWFGSGNSWLLQAEVIAGANAASAWSVEGIRTLPRDRGEGVVTLVSRIGADAAKRNVMLWEAVIVVLTAVRFGDLGLVVAGTTVPVLVAWVAIPAGALLESVLLHRADSSSDYDGVLIAQHAMTLLCAASMVIACWADASRIAGLLS